MFNKKPSSTFCASPWTALYLGSMGQYFNCCLQETFYDDPLKDSKGEPFHAAAAPNLEEIWNSPQLKEMRLEMLAGKWPKVCKACKDHEEAGMHSFRKTQNNTWSPHLKEFVKNTSKTGEFSFNLKKFDIKPGNDCNLRCNMCGPRYSKKTLLDWKSVYPDKKAKSSQQYRKNNWYENDEFWNQLFSNSQTISHLHFAGGEPFLSKKLTHYLERLSENSNSKNIRLSFNTNLTVLPEDLFKVFASFQEVDLHISLDATGSLNDYIRFPSRWEAMQTNLHRLDQAIPSSNFGVVNFNTVVQVYNIFQVTEFATYTANEFKHISATPAFFPLEGPSHFAITILPKNLREKAAQKIQDYCETGLKNLVRSDHWEKLKKDLLGLSQYILNGEYQASEVKEFLRVTEKYNNIRGLDIFTLQPDLASLGEPVKPALRDC